MITARQQECWDLAEQGLSQRQIAAQLETSQSTVHYHLGVARAFYDLDPAIKDSMVQVGTNMVPSLAWAKTKSADGTSYSVLLKPDPTSADALARIKAAFEDIPPAPAVSPPATERTDTLALLPHADFHLGMTVEAEEAGRDYNRKIAVERILDGMSQCLASTPNCAVAQILNCGDFTHSNDDSDTTFKSKHRLKTEGSHHDNIRLAIDTTANLIDMALQKHTEVRYRAIKGNHDPNTPAPLACAMEQRYRNEPRVKIEIADSPWWVMGFGKVFLSAHHGDGRNAKELAAYLPGAFPKIWGACEEWHLFTAHLHHHKSDTFGHVEWHQLPSVCSLDQYASGHGYGGKAGLKAMSFHKEDGMQSDYRCRL